MVSRCSEHSLGGRSGASLINLRRRVADVGRVGVLDSEHARSAVELRSQHLVGVHESFELAGQIVILAEEHTGMPVESILLSELIVEVRAKVGIGDGETLDVSSNGMQVLLSVLDADILGAQLSGKFHVARLSALNMLSQVIAVSADAVNVLSESADLDAGARVDVLEASDLLFGIIELHLSVSNFVGAVLNNLLHLGDAAMSLLQVKVQRLEAIVLVEGLLSLHVAHVSQSLDLSEHVGSLGLDEVNVALELSDLRSEVDNLIALGVTLVAQLARLEELLVEDALRSHELILQLHVLAGLVREHVLEVLNLLAAVSNLVHAAVESSATLHFRSDLLFTQKFVAVIHREDLVVNATIVTLLILEIVELLSQLSNQLILVAASDAHGRSRLHIIHD